MAEADKCGASAQPGALGVEGRDGREPSGGPAGWLRDSCEGGEVGWVTGWTPEMGLWEERLWPT